MNFEKFATSKLKYLDRVRALVNRLDDVSEKLGSIVARQLSYILFLPSHPLDIQSVSEKYVPHFTTSKDSHAAELED